jgi:RNA ligase (TIGR02306 family)
MMERKLASVQIIKEILPIEGADAIELAVVNGWKVVVAKNVGHKVGDAVIYCEIDSFLPIEPEFEFLRKSSYKKMGDQEGFRLKTIKLRGQVSQGLIIPLKDAYALYKRNTPNLDMGWFEGLDVTEMLGIVKYEPPIPAELAGKVKGLFPSFLRKTDEERIQNLSDKYEELKKHTYYVTEKLDGSSATFYVKDGVFGVCSRNLELAEPEPFVPGMIICEDGVERPKKENSFWKVANEMGLRDLMVAQQRNFSLQGELIGEGIQGNPYKIKGQTVRFFNEFDIDAHEYEDFEQFIWTLKSMGLQSVPVFDEEFKLPETVEMLLSYAEGKTSLGSGAEREGVVIRSLDRKISFKVISNKFLLGEKDK